MTKKGYQKRLPTVLPATSPRPAVPAPRASPESDAVSPVVEPVEPGETDDRGSPSTGTMIALVLAGLAVVGIAGFLLVPARVDNGPDLPAGVAGAGSPTGLDTSFVVSEVLPSGDVVVRQRIRSAKPVQLLRLELPLAPGAEGVSARQIDVVADGEAVVGPETIIGEYATFAFAPATDVRIHYRLTGAVERSESAPGRALAVVTSLQVQYAPRVERETRVVRASRVLLLACSRSPDEPPVPCGEPEGDSRWRVDLTGPRVDDRVVAQLTLG
jgi:hypothetical protein